MVTKAAAINSETLDDKSASPDPDNFKQTDVGLIPKDWDDPQLIDIARDDSPICYGIVQVGKFAPNGISVLAIKNLNSDYATDVHRAKVQVERAYARSRIRPDDILISVKGTIGRVGIVPSGFHGNISRDIARIRVREGIVPRFCFQMLQSDLAQRRFAMAAVGTTRMELSIATLKKVRIPVPPTEAEQEAIAETLSDLDELINALDQLIAKKQSIKHNVMKELLSGEKRLAGFVQKWQPKVLADLADIQRGASPRPIDSPVWYDAESNVGWVRISDVTASDGKHLRTTKDWLSPKGIANSRYLPAGSLIMSICATVGIPVVTEIDTCIHDGFVGFTKLRDVDQTFLYYKLKELETTFKSMGQTGSQSNLNTNLVKSCPVDLPGPEEQLAIAAILSDMDNELIALEQRREKTYLLKCGIMHELLSGRIRLI